MSSAGRGVACGDDMSPMRSPSTTTGGLIEAAGRGSAICAGSGAVAARAVM